MKPILYNANATSFRTLGLGVLADEYTTLVTEERNGQFYLEMKYPIDGKHFKELKNDRIIKAHASPSLRNQRFRIIRISKPAKGAVTVYAEHVSNHTASLPLKAGASYNGSASQALVQWANNIADAHPFTTYSDIITQGKGTWPVEDVENARQALGGIEGSILDTYGGEYRFDNYDISLLKQRGSDNKIPIMYGKNLIDLEQEDEIAETYTSIYPYAIYTPEREEGQKGDIDPVVLTLPEHFIDSEHVNKYARRKILKVNFSSDEIETVKALRERTEQYIQENDIGVPKVNLRVQFVDLAKTLDYKGKALIEQINLCDWVVVYFQKLDINQRAKVIRTVWNVGLDRYEEIEIGEVRASLTKSISSVVDGKVEKIEQQVNEVRTSANGKNKNHEGLQEPDASISKEGDTWFKPIGDGDIEIYRYNGYMWEFILSTADITKNTRDIEEQQKEIDDAKDAAQEAIDRLNGEVAGKFTTLDDAVANAQTRANSAFDIATVLAGDVSGFSLTIDGLNQTINNHSGQLSNLNNDIDGLSSTVAQYSTSLGNVVTQVSSLSNTIDGFDTTIANIDGRVTNFGTTIDGIMGTVQGLGGRVAAVELTADGLEFEVYDENGNSRITAIAGGIQTVVSSLENLQIGTNNLLPNTSDQLRSMTNSGWGAYLPDSSEFAAVNGGVEYSASTYLTQITGTVALSLRISWFSSEWAYLSDTENSKALNPGESGYIHTTGKAPATAAYAKVEVMRSANTGTTTFQFKETMLTQGNTMVSWTTPLDEMVSQSQIVQLTDMINLRVEKGDLLSQINIEADRMLFQSGKLFFDAETVTFSGTAFIPGAVIADASIDGAKIANATIGNAKIANLDVSKLSGGLSEFVRTQWNSSIGGSVEATGDGIISVSANGSTARIQNGVFLSTQPNGATVGYIGHAQTGSSPRFTIQTSLGAHFQVRQRYTNPQGDLADRHTLLMNANETLLDTDDFQLIGGSRRIGFGWRHYISLPFQDLILYE